MLTPPVPSPPATSPSTHPLWRPFDPAATSARTSRRVASRQVRTHGVAAPRDWTDPVARACIVVNDALGSDVLALEHVGSTAVPGLPAKPIVDLDLTVADSSDEDAYLPRLERAGFRLIAREPEWEQHRCLTFAEPNVNLHVFSPGAIEPLRHLVFRDHLRGDADDRSAYANAKRAAAGIRDIGEQHGAPDGTVDYNGAKAAVVYDIYERIFADDPAHDHDPHPR